MTHEQLQQLLDALPEEHTFIKQVILAVWYRVVDLGHIHFLVNYSPSGYMPPQYDYDLIRAIDGVNIDAFESIPHVCYEEWDRELRDLYQEVCGE